MSDKIYVFYEDRGPSGMCGQTVRDTIQWRKLFVFSSSECARTVLEQTRRFRMSPRWFMFNENDIETIEE